MRLGKTVKILAKKSGLGNQIQFIPVIRELQKEYEVWSDSAILRDLGVVPNYSNDKKADYYFTVFHYNHSWFWDELKKYKGRIAGFKYRIKGRHIGLGYHKSLRFNESKSEVDNNLDLYNHVLGKTLKEIPFRLEGKDPEKGKVIFGISPKAHKTVPKNTWIELKGKLEKDGYKVCTLDHDLGLGNHIQTPSLADLKNELCKAEYYIGTDSGVMHLADILEIPTVIVFGSTSILKNRPIYKKSVVLDKNLPCAPCYDWGRVDCKINYLCMKMGADEIYEGFRKLRESAILHY